MRFHSRSPKDYGVDRPDMEASQDVKSTGTNRPKQTHNVQHTHKQKNDDYVMHASTMQYLTQHLQGNTAPKVCRWLIAAGKRPDPFRTRKLSLPALMVLQPGGCGRVSYRRHKTINTQLNTQKEGKQLLRLLPFLLFVLYYFVE